MRLKFEISITIVAVVMAGLLSNATWKLCTAERYIKNVNENCIVVCKIDPVGDLQRFFNAQKNERYDCGPVDSIPGPKFREVTSNWVCDQYAELSVARMPKEGE